MGPEAWLLIGVALGAIPSSQLGHLMVAYLGKRMGVKPRELGKYAEAADGDDGE